MRALLITVALLALGADYPRHRRFMQRSFPPAASGACVPASGSAFGTGWSDFGAAKTVTLNSALSPSCAVDATRVQFSSAVGTHGTWWSPTVLCTVATGAKANLRLWVRGRSGSGTINLSTIRSAGPVYDYGDCPFTTTWSLCTYTTVGNMSAGDGPGVGSVGTMIIGLMGTLPNGGSGTGQTAAADVEVWGVGCSP